MTTIIFTKTQSVVLEWKWNVLITLNIKNTNEKFKKTNKHKNSIKLYPVYFAISGIVTISLTNCDIYEIYFQVSVK